MHFFLAYHISIILISLFLFILLRHTSGGTIAASNPRVAAQGRAAENNALGGAAGFGGGGFNRGFGGGGFYRRNLQEQEEEMIDEQEQEQFYVDQNVEEQQYHE